MKNVVFALFLGISCSSMAQEPAIDSTGLPGDHFSLQGALQLFKQASSPEELEKLLNTQDNDVNNLDLDGDGDIDYIRVIDRSDKTNHALVLQVAISATESQDIAVIELEKTGDATAVVQIVGDEDIYGEEVIVEPDGDEGAGAYLQPYNGNMQHGPLAANNYQTPGIVINVWLWPSVRFIYGPAYRPWISPWKWRAYPSWWRPWRPAPWHVFHPRCVRYNRQFVVVRTHRTMHVRHFYKPARISSVTIHNRHAASVDRYRVTRTKTTVTGPRGKSATRTTTTVRKNGKVKGSKTKVRRH